MSRRTSIRIVRNRRRKASIKKPSTVVAAQDVSENSRSAGDEVYILGGGPSLKHFDFLQLTDKCTIAVNKSIFHIPNPDYFISVDYTFLRKVSKQVFNSISARKYFVADFSHLFLKEVDKQITDTRYNMVYNLCDYNFLIRAYKQDGIGYTFKEFRTGRNSGFCALQLAVILGFKKIYLLGVDLNKEERTHYHEGYGEKVKTFAPKLDEYYSYFKVAIEQLKSERSDIQVISCSSTSRLNDIIPYKSSKEVLF